MNAKLFVSSPLRWLKTRLWILSIFTFTAGVAFAQTGTFQKSVGVGNGTLSYTVTVTAEACHNPGSGNVPGTAYISSYTDFSYTASGTTTPLSGGAYTYIDSPECTVYAFSGTLTGTGIVISFTPQPTTGGGATLSYNGYLNPKYKIVGVVYSPPGSSSFVQYTGTTMMGTSSSTQSSFATTESSSLTICGSAGIDIAVVTSDVKYCGTYSNSFTQESDTSSSFAVNQTTSFVNKWLGSSNGLNHNNDVVYVWLNPVVWFTIPYTNPPTATALQWNGYSSDGADDAVNGGEMEVVPIYLSQLLNPSSIAATDPSLYDRLQRTWAQNNLDGTGPGLTDADYAAIAAVDPFSNPDYVFSVPSGSQTSSDGRFTQTTNQNLDYQPGTATAGAPTFSYSWAQTATSTQGKGGKDTYTQGFSMEESFQASFFGGVSVDLKQGLKFQWMDQWNNLYTQQSGQTNQVSITGPPYCAPGSTTCTPYEGPQEFNIFQDNVYGTFMMEPVLSYFTISASPASQTVSPGSSTSFALSTVINDGYKGTLTLSMMPGLPTGASATFSPNPISAGGSSTLTITTTASTPAGTYPLAVLATDGTLIYYAYFTLVVATPDFSVTVSPSSQTITAGSGTTYAVSANALNGFSGNVTLTTGTLPSGISATFSPNPVAVGSSSTMTVTSTSSTAAGAYTLAVSGTSGSLSHTASPSPTLIVNAPPPSFTLAATPASRTVTVGAKATYTVSTTAVNGFSGVVSLSLSGLPSGATAAFSPTTITGAGSSTLTITTTTSLAAGSYPLTITGTSGSLTATASITLVADVPNFSISATPASQTIAAGGNTTYTVSTKVSNGFDGVVSLEASGLPAGASANFSPTSITGAGSSTLTVDSTTSIKAGTYTLTITGTSGSLTHTTTVKLVVSGADFSLAATPESQGVAAGTNAVYTVSTTALGGFTGSVALSLEGLPAATSAGFVPASISGAGSSTLTITTSTTTPVGNYTLTVTGTSGSLTHTATIVLTVDAS
jgi:hypothetical protein